MKILIILFVFVLSVPLVSAVKLGASNSSLEFNMETDEKQCKRIGIGTDYVGEITSDLKFARDYHEKLINNYNTMPDYFKISTEYEKNIYFEKPGNKETEICLIGKMPGNYSGLLVFKTKKNSASIGIFIKVHINKKPYNIVLLSVFLTPSIFLLILLILLLKKSIKESIN